MSDFKVIQNITIEELNRLASESGIKCENCVHSSIEDDFLFCSHLELCSNDENYYCADFEPKDQKEPAPLKTLNIEPYKLDK